MHEHELPTDAALVRRLLAAQFPQWAGLPVEPLASSGTVNALYRLGDDLVVRLPRLEWGARALALDREWLSRLAPLLPVEIPVPIASGAPSAEFPWEWGIYPWLDGVHPDCDAEPEPLAAFVRALHDVRLDGAPPARRGRPLGEAQDESTRAALRELDGVIDVDAASRAWEASLAAPPWTGPPVWIHGDLLPGNLLVRDGRLTGVIDWGAVGVGDPAVDLIPAWGSLPAGARDAFRSALGVDDATWARGRGWALSIGLIALPYYVETNPVFAETARVLIRETLADSG
jgi:aminoglycoside phosphotransferase (APT) family kinase protein